jgi:hypothetical protein
MICVSSAAFGRGRRILDTVDAPFVQIHVTAVGAFFGRIPCSAPRADQAASTIGASMSGGVASAGGARRAWRWALAVLPVSWYLELTERSVLLRRRQRNSVVWNKPGRPAFMWAAPA